MASCQVSRPSEESQEGPSALPAVGQVFPSWLTQCPQSWAFKWCLHSQLLGKNYASRRVKTLARVSMNTKPPSAPSCLEKAGQGARDVFRGQRTTKAWNRETEPAQEQQEPPSYRPTHLPPGLGEAGLSSHEVTQTTAVAASFLCSFLLTPCVGQKSRDSQALAGFQGMFLHFFCRTFCLALMNARMSESVWLSPVRGMDDIGLSEMLRTNTSHNFKSHYMVFLDVAFPPGCCFSKVISYLT